MSTITPPRLAVQFNNSTNVVGVDTIAEAQAFWRRMLVCNDWGASDAPSVRVINVETGEPIARISYNGRAWDMQGKEIK